MTTVHTSVGAPTGWEELRSLVSAGDRNAYPVDPTVPDGVVHQHFVLGNPPQARLTAFLDPFHEGIGGIGLYEAKDVPTEELFLAAESWLRENGCREVWGPVDFSIWRRYRFMTGGFEHPSFVGEPYNPPYYPEQFEQAGYRSIQRWASTMGVWEDFPKALALLKPYYDSATRQGYRFEPSTAERLEADLETIFPIMNAAFRRFVGYSPISIEHYWAVVRPMIPTADPETIILVQDPSGNPVAFQITLPDIRTDLPRPRYIQWYTGRMPEGKGNRAALGKAVLYATLNALYQRGNPVDVVAAIMSTGNHSRALAASVTAPYKEYAFYGKALTER